MEILFIIGSELRQLRRVKTMIIMTEQRSVLPTPRRLLLLLLLLVVEQLRQCRPGND
jgi:hypothetical protein